MSASGSVARLSVAWDVPLLAVRPSHGAWWRDSEGILWPLGRCADQRGRIAAGDRRDHRRRCVAVGVRQRLPRRRPAGPGSWGRSGWPRRARLPCRDGRLGCVRAGLLGARAAGRARHLQRALPGPRRGGEDARRRTRPGRNPDERILPVRIATDRVRELDALSGDPDEVRARLSERIPLRRYGEPEEFGRVAAFLLSPAASYITGAMIPVDGGAIRSI
jgi:Enoyl-(Acyl carrier protein) reductase